MVHAVNSGVEYGLMRAEKYRDTDVSFLDVETETDRVSAIVAQAVMNSIQESFILEGNDFG